MHLDLESADAEAARRVREAPAVAINPKTGFACDCATRLECYDGLICHWHHGAAFDKAFRHWDLRGVFVIAGWFLDEVDGYKPDRMTRTEALIDEAGRKAVPFVWAVMAWRWIGGWFR